MKVKIIDGMTSYTIRCYPPKKFYEYFSYTKWLGETRHEGVAWTTHCDDVNLNIVRIQKEAIDNNISFDEMLSHCISHEIMHNILQDMDDKNINEQFDNICHSKNDNFATWIGGVG